jgi:hypothetical protein
VHSKLAGALVSIPLSITTTTTMTITTMTITTITITTITITTTDSLTHIPSHVIYHSLIYHSLIPHYLIRHSAVMGPFLCPTHRRGEARRAEYMHQAAVTADFSKGREVVHLPYCISRSCYPHPPSPNNCAVAVVCVTNKNNSLHATCTNTLSTRNLY